MAKLNTPKKNKMNESLKVKAEKFDENGPKMTPGLSKKAKRLSVTTPKGITNGTKRKAENDAKLSPKKMKVTIECDDEILKSQYERFYEIEAQNAEYGINKLRLVVSRVPRETTTNDLKKLFPNSTQVEKAARKFYLLFASEDESKKAFDDSHDLHIHDRKVDVLYDNVKGRKYDSQTTIKKKIKTKHTECFLKKLTEDFDVNDEFIQAQYKRIAVTEKEKLANGIDRLRLQLFSLRKDITEDDIKEAFPKSTKIEMLRRNAFVSFSSPADAHEAFEAAEDLTINEQTVRAKYVCGGENGAECDEKLLEAQYDRAVQIERSRLVFGVRKLELIVKWLPKGTTIVDLMEAFPRATRANMNKYDDEEGYVNFGTVEDAKLAFDGSLEKTIKKKKVAVLYSNLTETDVLVANEKKGGGRGRGGVRGGFQKRN